jgi:hypothetical protein
MDAPAALSKLVEVSTEVVEAVVVDASGSIVAARCAGDERARALAEGGLELLSTAGRLRPAEPVERVQVDLARGSVVVATDGERTVAATTVASPSSALVAHDLRAVLRRLGGEGR